MKTNLRWAYKTLILSVFLSIGFSLISQGLFPNLPIIFSLLIIFFFIFLSVIFDMIGIAVASIKIENLEKYQNQKGYETAKKLSRNKDKVSSFCGDVVGDICGILSGAGGVSIVVNLNITNQTAFFLTTCLTSSIIAGLTIFGKAVMKGYAVEKCEKVVMKTACVIEVVFSTNPFRNKKKENN